ncbi:MAG: hypothetical protein JGK17_25890 [Microcoleus sp. PH2017_10_PVI_O_A]|uniref:hypothetical protein n=1 Tax=unclassified Microcoleus TaxID=2642155 RepID=UPI001D51EE5C|nr:MULTISPECIES: hypothetical protein [unclassified Microcoleus]TAE77880.1 MAG: hypothetical protein EAZ83_25635 [Oscillatoriales cyanobacterium]MCC3408944.1 hypothetical protein [Microcoleus sp. PH2017_10_PVI_O_A]MCC3463079.1 hypothetical protein [Microcoleus sp. PH2017_11_PCY_U_A]MCC3481466.1 hypothetical protein [Microcoleus sp. PH2017_12_PCY_D_A]MCC3531466.1 hypothetical protein [Microcoleus sp. PH2017_21_RUC_O_A]
MENLFNSFKARIELGIKNNIPVEARLIVLGELIYAAERKDLTPKQARELEALLRLSEILKNYQAIREQAIFGELLV